VWHVEASGGHRWPGRKDVAAVDGKQRGIGEGPRGLGNGEGRGAEDGADGEGVEEQGGEVGDEGCFGLGSHHGDECHGVGRRRHLSLFLCLLSEVDLTGIQWT
jgi:hypothetical protein